MDYGVPELPSGRRGGDGVRSLFILRSQAIYFTDQSEAAHYRLPTGREGGLGGKTYRDSRGLHLDLSRGKWQRHPNQQRIIQRPTNLVGEIDHGAPTSPQSYQTATCLGQARG